MNSTGANAQPDSETLPQPPMIALMGPTAVGKSAFAIELADRLKSGAEIVSVDSAQIYRGMDIGTAKPDAATRARVAHHLLDIVDPAEVYSAARFAEDAGVAIAGIRARGHVPILVGGTGLYFRALLKGLSPLPAADQGVRARLEAEARELGWGVLHQRLALADPETAQRLHPNDAQRIQRALEIFELTGEPPSQLHGRGRSDAGLGRWRGYALMPSDRVALHARIEERFRQMLAQGLLAEVRGLHGRGDLHPALPSVRAVGYRQLWAHLDGHCSLEQAVERAIAATRQYAKRQLTWLRGESTLEIIDSAEPQAIDVVLRDLKAGR